MKTHCRIGYEILKGKRSKYLKAGAIIALTHHEKYNGTGYPDSLKGDDIHKYGRIVSVVDVFDAVSSNRVSKRKWTFEQSVTLINDEKGKHFDPFIVDIFIDCIDKIKKIYMRIQDY